jgi:flagellar export protein FliJ
MKVDSTGLTTVLKVKQFQEKSTQKELAEIKTARESEEQRLGSLEASKTSAMVEAGGVVKSSVGDLQTARAFIQSITRQINQQEQRVDAVKQQEDTKRTELVERTQSRQMVEKLDTKRKDEALKESERRAQRVIDVLAQRTKPA